MWMRLARSGAIRPAAHCRLQKHPRAFLNNDYRNVRSMASSAMGDRLQHLFPSAEDKKQSEDILNKLGVRQLEDLSYLTARDLIEAGMPLVSARKLIPPPVAGKDCFFSIHSRSIRSHSRTNTTNKQTTTRR
jgi:hypothetical protein